MTGKREKIVTVSVVLTKTMISQLDRVARAQDKSRSSVVRAAIVKYIKEQENLLDEK